MALNFGLKANVVKIPATSRNVSTEYIAVMEMFSFEKLKTVFKWFHVISVYSFPKNCAEVKAISTSGLIDDAEYCLLTQNKLVSIYCHNMDTSPKEYITLRYLYMHYTIILAFYWLQQRKHTLNQKTFKWKQVTLWIQQISK